MKDRIDRVLKKVGYSYEPVYMQREKAVNNEPEFPIVDEKILDDIVNIAKNIFNKEVEKLGQVSLSESDMISLHECLACGAVTYATQEYDNGKYINNIYYRDWEYIVEKVYGGYVGFSGHQVKTASFVDDFILKSFTDTIKESEFINSYTDKLSDNLSLSKKKANKLAQQVVSYVNKGLLNVKTAGFIMPVDLTLDEIPLTDTQYNKLKRSYENKKRELNEDLEQHFSKCSFIKKFIKDDVKTSSEHKDFPLMDAAIMAQNKLNKNVNKHIQSFGVTGGTITYSTENISKFVKFNNLRVGNIVVNKLLGVKGRITSFKGDQVVVDWGNSFTNKITSLKEAMDNIEKIKYNNRKNELNKIEYKLSKAINVETHKNFEG